MLKKCLQRKYFFDKIRNSFNKKTTEKTNNVEDDDNNETDSGFKGFTQYLIERKEYKWRDYEAQIEVNLFILV
jgi:hypothetical protein